MFLALSGFHIRKENKRKLLARVCTVQAGEWRYPTLIVMHINKTNFPITQYDKAVKGSDYFLFPTSDF
jgi:hypothetical protein